MLIRDDFSSCSEDSLRHGSSDNLITKFPSSEIFEYERGSTLPSSHKYRSCAACCSIFSFFGAFFCGLFALAIVMDYPYVTHHLAIDSDTQRSNLASQTFMASFTYFLFLIISTYYCSSYITCCSSAKGGRNQKRS